MLVKDIHPEYFPKQNQSFDVPHRKLDTVHYIRKNPTKKMKRIKNFLDKQDVNPDISKVQLNQELDALWLKFDHLKRVREVSRAKKMQRRLNKSAAPVQKNLTTDMTNFLEYYEYVEMFAMPNSNLYDKIRPKPGQNAETFIKVYKEFRDKKIKRLNELIPSNSASKDVTERSKTKMELLRHNDSAIILEESPLNRTAPLIPQIDTNQPSYLEIFDDEYKPPPKLRVIDEPEFQKLKDKTQSYVQHRPPPGPKLADYDLMGSKRTKALQVTYYRKLGILDSLRVKTPVKENKSSLKLK